MRYSEKKEFLNMRILEPLLWPTIILFFGRVSSEDCSTCPDSCGENFEGSCSCMFTEDGIELTICEEVLDTVSYESGHSHDHDCEENENGIYYPDGNNGTYPQRY